MTEKNYAPSATEKKVSAKIKPQNAPVAADAPKTEVKAEENKVEVKDEKKKKVEVKIVPKDCAIVRGVGLPISKKTSGAILHMIKGKSIDTAIKMVEEVIIMKRAVPMNNMEVPHRKGPGMMAGRYPLNSSKALLDLLKQLKANASVNSVENPVIFMAKADKASRPHKRGGMRAKRAHIYIEARDKTKLTMKNRKK